MKGVISHNEILTLYKKVTFKNGKNNVSNRNVKSILFLVYSWWFQMGKFHIGRTSKNFGCSNIEFDSKQ